MLLPLSIIMVLYAVLTFYFRSKYLEKKQASHPARVLPPARTGLISLLLAHSSAQSDAYACMRLAGVPQCFIAAVAQTNKWQLAPCRSAFSVTGLGQQLLQHWS